MMLPWANAMDMHFLLKNNMYIVIPFIKAFKSDGHLNIIKLTLLLWKIKEKRD
jgi:hypothetical protein